MNYPIVSAGLVLGPRGVGTMGAMLVVGKLTGRVDTRLLLDVGLVLTAWSFYEMTGWTPDISQMTIIGVGVIQGIGLGFIFVPLSVVTLSTMSSELRAEGAGLYSLSRNIGSSVGISVVNSMAVQKLMKGAVLETHGAALRVAPVAVHGSGVEKYGSTGVLASSADRGWSGLSAQLRTHSNGVIAWKNTQPDTEICVDIRGNRSVITRQGGGIFDRTIAERGTIWLSPAGLQEDYIDISDPVPGIMHIYLPPSHFSPNSLGVDLDKSVIVSLRYESLPRPSSG